MFLLDTVVIFELRKKSPNTHVIQWLSAQREENLYLSVVTLGEIGRSVEKRRKGDPAFAEVLEAWLESLTSLYSGKILPVTPAIARRWGRLSATLGHDGADLLIAATGLIHNLTVVTRNTVHFKPTGVNVIDPFKA